MWSEQEEAFEVIAKHGSCTLEVPTGMGKTAIGYTTLKALGNRGEGPLFYIVPTKTLVGQVAEMFPDVTPAYGRNEFDCLYYDEPYKADEVPCLLLQDCVHRVDQETGRTAGRGAERCPYYHAKYQAKRDPSRIVVCSMSFYLFTQLFSKEFENPAGLVIDEVQQMPDVVRNALSFDITDYQLQRAINLLSTTAADEAAGLEIFLDTMLRIIRLKPSKVPVMLEDVELQELLLVLRDIDRDGLRRKIAEGIRSGDIDVVKEREVLTKVERLVYDLYRYVRAFEFSLSNETQRPLNYTYAVWDKEPAEGKKVHNKLTVKSYYVAPVIKKLLSANLTVSLGATIGDPNVFGYESGIDPRRTPMFTFDSSFPVGNTRIYVPSDSFSLAEKEVKNRGKATMVRRMVRSAKTFNQKGERVLCLVVSDTERQRFIRMATEDDVNFITYGDGVTAREAADRFRAGEGKVLLGTDAQYGQGVDLPDGICRVIFYLRPGYPRPDDPQTQFEEKRFRSQKWAIWQWRLIMKAMQVRGRNIRGPEDRGVTIFFDSRFRRFLFGGMPKWLQPSYRGDLTLQECIEDALKVLK